MRHPPLVVAPAATRVLQARVDGVRATPAQRLRARIVLLSGAGLGPAAIAEQLSCSTQTVVTWRERFRESGVEGLSDAPRSGRPVTVDAEAVIRATVLPGGGAPPWSSRSLARHLGVSNVTVANVWRQWGVRPGPSGRVRLRLDPELDRLPVAVLGLHVDHAVRVAAVAVDDLDGQPAPSGGRGAGLGPPLARLVAASGGAGPSGDRELGRFLDDLGGAAGPAPVHLIVEGADEPIRRWARAAPGTQVHVVPPALSWQRVVLVAGLGAGTATARGRATVDRLGAALDRAPGIPFSWTAAEPGRPTDGTPGSFFTPAHLIHGRRAEERLPGPDHDEVTGLSAGGGGA